MKTALSCCALAVAVCLGTNAVARGASDQPTPTPSVPPGAPAPGAVTPAPLQPTFAPTSSPAAPVTSAAPGQAGSTEPPAAIPAAAPATQPLAFQLHAQFYSQLTNREPAIDPQVFVQDVKYDAGTGPQGIDHAKGFRPAHLDDAPELSLYNADGEQLLFTLEKWIGATGSASVQPQTSGDRVVVQFAKLVPFGVYSLFKLVLANGTTTFAPLDGDGTGDGFIAGVDGSANFAVTAPAHLASGNAIVLVYHSDALDHGMSRGDLGITAHEELIARLP